MAYYSPYGNWPPINNEPSMKGHSLRRDANFVGIVTLLQAALLQLFFVALILGLQIFGIVDIRDSQYYGLGNTGFLLLYAFAYIVGMALPGPLVAMISGRCIRPFSRYDSDTGESTLRLSGILFAPLTGLSLCVVANFITNYIVYFFSNFGIYPPDMPGYMEKTALSLMLNVVVFAVLPAIFEEMLFRGYILRALRSYGDGVALLVSTLLFALMHGNILQIPFAFMVGAVCGYLVLRTGSIFPSILLHFLNNFMSTLLQYVGLYVPDERSTQVTLITFSLIGVVGLAAVVMLFAMDDVTVRRRLRPQNAHSFSGGFRAKALMLSIPLIISVLISLLLTVLTTQTGGAA